MAFRAGVGVLLTALMIPPLLARIRAEERLLRSQFGDEYRAYCARTARLLPRLYKRCTRRLPLTSAHRCGVAEHADPSMPA